MALLPPRKKKSDPGQTPPEDDDGFFDQLRVYRRERFARMGFDIGAAIELSTSRADLHDVAGLLDRGAPHDLVKRIVL